MPGESRLLFWQKKAEEAGFGHVRFQKDPAAREMICTISSQTEPVFNCLILVTISAAADFLQTVQTDKENPLTLTLHAPLAMQDKLLTYQVMLRRLFPFLCLKTETAGGAWKDTDDSALCFRYTCLNAQAIMTFIHAVPFKGQAFYELIETAKTEAQRLCLKTVFTPVSKNQVPLAKEQIRSMDKTELFSLALSLGLFSMRLSACICFDFCALMPFSNAVALLYTRLLGPSRIPSMIDCGDELSEKMKEQIHAFALAAQCDPDWKFRMVWPEEIRFNADSSDSNPASYFPDGLQPPSSLAKKQQAPFWKRFFKRTGDFTDSPFAKPGKAVSPEY